MLSIAVGTTVAGKVLGMPTVCGTQQSERGGQAETVLK